METAANQKEQTFQMPRIQGNSINNDYRLLAGSCLYCSSTSLIPYRDLRALSYLHLHGSGMFTPNITLKNIYLIEKSFI